MASKLSFLNSLRDRKKLPHNKDGNKIEELSIVKAAAWAWYQHKYSSHEIKAMNEFDATTMTTTTNRRESKPSRYKLEAMRSSMSKETKEESLLDAYEVQSISRHLNLLLEPNPNHNKHVIKVASESVHDHDGGGSTKKKKKKNVRKGFFLRHGAICGREEDVVIPTRSTTSSDHRHSQSSKRALSNN